MNFIDVKVNGLHKKITFDAEAALVNPGIEHVTLQHDWIKTLLSDIGSVDNNDEILDCEFAGYYDNDTKLWYWTWVLPNITCSETSLSNQIINYGLKLNNNDPSSLEYLYKLLFINPIINLKIKLKLIPTAYRCWF